MIGWLVLPFVTVTQRATTPVPPVIVHVPWDGILLLDLGSAVALGLAVIVIGSVLRRLGRRQHPAHGRGLTMRRLASLWAAGTAPSPPSRRGAASSS